MDKAEAYKVAVLIPCHNEVQTIGKVIADFHSVLPDAAIYVCDNGSVDGTSDAASFAGATVIAEPRLGKGNAVRALFRRVEADIYILVDGDDTYPAESSLEMLDAIKNGRGEMVVGDRLSKSYFNENKRKFHNSGNKLVRFLINKLFNVRLKDVLSGYRAFTRDYVKNFTVMSEGFEVETEMTVHALEKGYSISEIQVDYRDRPAGSSSKLSTFRDGRRVLLTIMLLFRDYRPMAFFAWAALIFFIVGLGFFMPVVVEYWQTGLVPRFPTLIVGCFIMLFAMLLFFVGLILDVIKRNDNRQWMLHTIHEDSRSKIE